MNTESREQIESTAAAWIMRRDSAEWTPAAETEFAAWLAASASHRAAYYRLNATWHEVGRLKALVAGTPPGAVASPQELQANLFGQHHSVELGSDDPEAGVHGHAAAAFGRASFRTRALAATLILALGAGFYAYKTDLFNLSSYSTPVGGLDTVALDDGSQVTLNTDSRIRVDLREGERRITLNKGEAFFEVAKDPLRPFIVEVGDKRVIAVGTQFSVRRDVDDVRVFVTEGTVRLESTKDTSNERNTSANPDTTGRVLLTAGAIARTERDAVLVQENRTAELEQKLSWRTGYLTFRNTRLADAVAEFNRYNTRKIIIEDPSVAGIEIGGIFRSTRLDAFLHLLEDGFPIEVTEEEGRIVLTAAQ